MTSSFLRDLVQTMHEGGDTVAIIAAQGKKNPTVIEYVRRPDSVLVHDQMRLLDAANEQRPHSRD